MFIIIHVIIYIQVGDIMDKENFIFSENSSKKFLNQKEKNVSKSPEKTVILLHLGGWYKVYSDGAKIISFLMDYKLFEDSRTAMPSIGFPESSIEKVINVLKSNKINYILKYDDNKLIDFGEENNFDKFLHHDLPYSYVVHNRTITKKPFGTFKVQYEGEEEEEYIIGENISVDAELTKSVTASNVGDTIKINDFYIKIIDKEIYFK